MTFVPKSAADNFAFTEEISPFTDVFRWQGIGYSSVSPALGTVGGKPIAVFDATGSGVIFVAYQTGTKGVTGLAFRPSADRGATWGTETQIDADQDKYVAAVVDPDTGNIHLVYAKLGDPALDNTDSLCYRVLAWSGSAWSVSGEVVLATGTTVNGWSDVTLGVNSERMLRVLAGHKAFSTTTREVYSVLATAEWDLSYNTLGDVIAMATPGVEARMAMAYDAVGDVWYLITEQSGTFRLWSVGEEPINLKTWYAASTDEFDAVFNQMTGTVGIIQDNGSLLEFREYNPATNGLTETEFGAGCMWPSIAADGAGRFVVACVQSYLSDDNYSVMTMRSDDWSTAYRLCTDTAARYWAYTRIAPTQNGLDGLAITWCESYNPGASGYAVFCGVLDEQVFKNVSDLFPSAEVNIPGIQVTDLFEDAETAKAAVPKESHETMAFAEALAGSPEFADLFAVTEQYWTSHPAEGETIAVTESMRFAMAVVDHADETDAVRIVWQIRVAESAEAQDDIAQLLVKLADTAPVTETFLPTVLSLAEAVAASDGTVIDLLVVESSKATEDLVVGHAVADDADLSEIIGMAYGILENVATTELFNVGQVVIESVGADDSIVWITLPVDETMALHEHEQKDAVARIGIRIHLHRGRVHLKVEGGYKGT
jgi:hypothetical protein